MARNHVSRAVLALILCLSAFLQFSVVSRTEVISPIRGDANDYLSYAYNLAHFNVYSSDKTWATKSTTPVPDANRPPGYPVFLTAVATPQANRAYVRQVTMAQAALGVASVLLAFLIASQFLGTMGSLISALITALSPHLAVINTYLLTESLFFFLLLSSLYVQILAMRSERRWQFALAGVLWACTSLVRPTVQFVPILLLLGAATVPAMRRYRTLALIGALTFAITLAPWMLRNLSPDVRPLESGLMVRALAHGSYPGMMFEGKPESIGYPYRYDPRAEEIARDLPSALKHIASQFASEPAKYTQWYLIGKPLLFLSWANTDGWDIYIFPPKQSPYYDDANFKLLREAMQLLHWPLMAFGLIGIALLAFSPKRLGLAGTSLMAARVVAALICYAIVFHMLVAPFPRYGIPFRPLLYPLAVLPVHALWLAFLASNSAHPQDSGVSAQRRYKAMFWSASALGAIVVCALTAWAMISLIGWYLMNCGESVACSSAELMIDYWWAIFVPCCLLATYYLRQLYDRQFARLKQAT